MNLKKLIQGLDIVSCEGETNREITSIHYDSRKCQKNSMFIAINGFNTDGHEYISEAIENGATTILYKNEVNKKQSHITYIKVKNSRLAMATLSNRFYDYPSKKMKLIGITGTNGKTTISFLLGEIFKQWGVKLGIIGTLGNYLGETLYKGTHTTPESVDLQQILHQINEEHIPYTVMEVSSHSLELNRVEDTNFDIGIFTNLSQDHLDFHKNFENYFQAKAKLFHMTDKVNIINGDDIYGEKLISLSKGREIPVYSYGIKNNCDFVAKNIKIDNKGAFFTVNIENNSEGFYINIPGIFSIYNALAAIVLAYIEGIPLEITRKALANLPGVPGRFEMLDTNTPYGIIIDYAHTPAGLENILKTIREFSKGNVIVVFGCGGDRDKGKRPIMGEVAGLYADFMIITSDNPRNEEPLSIIKDIVPGIKKTGKPYKIIEDRKSAIKSALAIGKKDDIILIAGKGHERYQIIQNEIIPFDEKKIINQLLGEGEVDAKDD